MLIDGKGRIFGKINIIDFGILLLIIFVLLFWIKGCLTMPNMSEAIKKAKIEILVEEQKKFSDEMAKISARAKTINDEMIKAQAIWYEGFREGYGTGKSGNKK